MRAIHYACWQGNVDPVAMLLKAGSDANEATYDGKTPLHWACEHGHYDVVSSEGWGGGISGFIV